MGVEAVRIGVHVSIAGSIDRAVDRAVKLGCNTFQMFTRNPRGWNTKPLVESEANAFRSKLYSSKIVPAVAHMPYLPNLASPDPLVYSKSKESLSTELERCARLRIPYLVTHLGSHLGSGTDSGLKQITRAINEALDASDGSVMLLLENTAGTKNSMGSTFESLKLIMGGIAKRRLVGVCFDTAHAYAAGYDLRTSKRVDETLSKFDSALGLGAMKAVHLNDSKFGLGSGRDRHEHIGLGYIGAGGFRAILQNRAFRGLPLIMETPVDSRGGDERNLLEARSMC